MSEPKFTPGEWRVVNRRNCEHWILNENDLCIATVHDAPPMFHIDGKANAALIAMAPEMYRALEKAKKQIYVFANDPSSKAVADGYCLEIDNLLQKARRQ